MCRFWIPLINGAIQHGVLWLASFTHHDCFQAHPSFTTYHFSLLLKNTPLYGTHFIDVFISWTLHYSVIWFYTCRLRWEIEEKSYPFKSAWLCTIILKVQNNILQYAMKANIQIKRGTYIKSLNTKTTLKTLKHSNSIMAPPPLSVLRP